MGERLLTHLSSSEKHNDLSMASHGMNNTINCQSKVRHQAYQNWKTKLLKSRIPKENCSYLSLDSNLSNQGWIGYLPNGAHNSCLIKCCCSWIDSQNMSPRRKIWDTRKIVSLGERYNTRHGQLVLSEASVKKNKPFM